MLSILKTPFSITSCENYVSGSSLFSSNVDFPQITRPASHNVNLQTRKGAVYYSAVGRQGSIVFAITNRENFILDLSIMQLLS